MGCQDQESNFFLFAAVAALVPVVLVPFQIALACRFLHSACVCVYRMRVLVLMELSCAVCEIEMLGNNNL